MEGNVSLFLVCAEYCNQLDAFGKLGSPLEAAYPIHTILQTLKLPILPSSSVPEIISTGRATRNLPVPSLGSVPITQVTQTETTQLSLPSFPTNSVIGTDPSLGHDNSSTALDGGSHTVTTTETVEFPTNSVTTSSVVQSSQSVNSHSTSPDEYHLSDLRSGKFAGSVVGPIAAVVMLICFLLYLRARRKRVRKGASLIIDPTPYRVQPSRSSLTCWISRRRAKSEEAIAEPPPDTTVYANVRSLFENREFQRQFGNLFMRFMNNNRHTSLESLETRPPSYQ